MHKIYCCLLMLLILKASALPPVACKTHILCSAEMPCTCSLGASSAFHRYFYLNFTNIQKDKYQCYLKTFLNNEIIVGAAFPKGIKIKYSNSYPRFPVELMLDTRASTDKVNIIEIKFMVPASDIADEIKAVCHKSFAFNNHI